jgi:gamma-glutamylcyclotransferase
MDGSVLARRLGRTDARGFARRRGLLPDFAIAFSKVSSSDPTIGYATLVSCNGARVEGVLNNLTDTEIARLDEIELVPEHYTRATVGVIDTSNGKTFQSVVYLANPDKLKPGLKPLLSYVETLLGGRDVLSPSYVAQLTDLTRACSAET